MKLLHVIPKYNNLIAFYNFRPSQCRYSVKIQLSRILLEGSSGSQNSKTERQNTWSLEPITEEQENLDSDDCWFHFPDKKVSRNFFMVRTVSVVAKAINAIVII